MNNSKKKIILNIKREYKNLKKFDKDLEKNYNSILGNYKNILLRNDINDSKILKNPFNKKLKKIIKNKNNILLTYQINYAVELMKNIKDSQKSNEQIIKNNLFHKYKELLNQSKRRIRNVKKIGVDIPENNIFNINLEQEKKNINIFKRDPFYHIENDLLDIEYNGEDDEEIYEEFPYFENEYIDDEGDIYEESNILVKTAITQSLKGKVKYIKFDNTNKEKIKPYELLTKEENINTLVKEIIENTKDMKSINLSLIPTVEFVPNPNKENYENFNTVKYIKSHYTPIYDLTPENIKQAIKNLAEECEDACDDIIAAHSFVSIAGCDGAGVSVGATSQLSGSSYIELPEIIQKKNAVINVKNEDQNCFLYSVLCHFKHKENVKHLERVSIYKKILNTLNLEYIEEEHTEKIKNKYIDTMTLKEIKEYEYEHLEEEKEKLNLNKTKKVMIQMPMAFNDIRKFEKINSDKNISINVYGYTIEKVKKDNTEVDKVIFCVRHISNEIKENHINLLYIEDDERNGHYCYITDMSRLLNKTHNYSKKSNLDKSYFCLKCLKKSKTEEESKNHMIYCGRIDDKTACIMPAPERRTLKFKNIGRQHEVEFIIYGDFEAITKIDIEKKGDKTQQYQRHIPVSFCLYLNCNVSDELNELVIYSSEDEKDLMNKFFETIIYFKEKVENIIKTVKPINKLTQEEKEKHDKNKNCNFCKKEYTKKNIKVRDHCHITGNYRQALCNSCNLLYRMPKHIPIIFHNLKNYDSNFIFNHFGLFHRKYECIYEISGISGGSHDKFLCFNIKNKKSEYYSVSLNFIDSFQFLSSSLEDLVEKLPISNMKQTKNYHKNLNSHQFNLIITKGVFPYDWFNNYEKMEKKRLPTYKKFYSQMNKRNIDQKLYMKACDVWNSFNMNNFKDYHDLYLITDVLLLCDCFNDFRKSAINCYNLDPANYISLPSYSLDAMLKYTEINIQLLDNQDLYELFETNNRGGICSVGSSKHEIANNKYMVDYDENLPSSYDAYIDANNLYGWAMMQKLPFGGIKIIQENIFDKEEIKKSIEFIKNHDFENSDIGYNFEIDVIIDVEYHDYYKNFAPFCVSRNVKYEELSDIQKDILKSLSKKQSKSKKLIMDFTEKNDYLIHGRLLQYFLKLGGVIITKIKKVIQYNQSDFLYKYVKFNSEMRAKAKSDSEKDFYKLCVNAVYGKMLESVRKHCDTLFLDSTQIKKYNKVSNRNLIKNINIIDEDFCIIQKKKDYHILNKPIFIGFSILEISKLLIYKHIYDKLIPRYGLNNFKIIYGDTDSIIFKVFTEDFYSDMIKYEDDYDLSEMKNKIFLDENGKPKYNKNKKIPGPFKCESHGVPIKSVVILSAKMYAYEKAEMKEEYIFEEEKKQKEGNYEVEKDYGISRRCKGTKKYIVRDELTYNNYIDVLYNKKNIDKYNNGIRSKDFKISSLTVLKTALCCYDDKKYMIDEKTCVPYGHYSLLKKDVNNDIKKKNYILKESLKKKYYDYIYNKKYINNEIIKRNASRATGLAA